MAYLHRSLVARVPGFTVVGTVTNAQDALDAVSREHPHLLLLDLSLRGTDGIALLRRLRGAGVPIDAIAVTAARQQSVVRSLMHLGVVDYLVKPFTPERFYKALAQFRRTGSGPSPAELSQSEIDALRLDGQTAHRWLPKGLSEHALERVRGALDEADDAVTAAWVADQVSMARVTVRRYLEYLVTTQQAGCRAEADGPGRPRKLYWRAA